MGGEIFTTAVLVFGMILVGLSVGFLMLKVQGSEE
ncbi:MAG: PetM family cytochrome b6-f complex subunit 7 [Phormidesmis sp.]